MTQTEEPLYRMPVWLKWAANGFFVIATVSLLNPDVASHSVSPWVFYLVGNGIWLVDTFGYKSWPWFTLSFFFSVWDILLILSRTTHFTFGFLEHFVRLLGLLP